MLVAQLYAILISFASSNFSSIVLPSTPFMISSNCLPNAVKTPCLVSRTGNHKPCTCTLRTSAHFHFAITFHTLPNDSRSFTSFDLSFAIDAAVILINTNNSTNFTLGYFLLITSVHPRHTRLPLQYLLFLQLLHLPTTTKT